MERPIVLFGAFDRHNLGDLLFPHVAAALLPGHELICAGLADRDLRPRSGHEVIALATLAARWRQHPAAWIHVGGEILTCDAWQAAVMLQAPQQVQDLVAYLEPRSPERFEWVRRTLGFGALAPYTLAREMFPGVGPVIYAGVGGVGLDACDPDLRAEVLGKLRAADSVSVRDRVTLAHLHAAGLDARLIPDPAVMVAELFGARIRERMRVGDVAEVLRAFPQGYVAVQFSADFGDDPTLARIAAQLDRVAHAHACGVALFRAGAAPWHDDLQALQRLAARMRPASVRVVSSLGLWDICALIAASRAYCGSSLHGRIVATAFALPRVNLRPPAPIRRVDKATAFATTWDDPGVPTTVDVDELEGGVRDALAVEPARLRHKAGQLARAWRQGFEPIRRMLQGDPGT